LVSPETQAILAVVTVTTFFAAGGFLDDGCGKR
jgi:hypothetical protein